MFIITEEDPFDKFMFILFIHFLNEATEIHNLRSLMINLPVYQIFNRFLHKHQTLKGKHLPPNNLFCKHIHILHITLNLLIIMSTKFSGF